VVGPPGVVLPGVEVEEDLTGVEVEEELEEEELDEEELDEDLTRTVEVEEELNEEELDGEELDEAGLAADCLRLFGFFSSPSLLTLASESKNCWVSPPSSTISLSELGCCSASSCFLLACKEKTRETKTIANLKFYRIRG
jgi:hypothetical protein